MQGIRWYTQLETAPASEPISTADAKAQLNIESGFSTDDDLIDAYVEAARVHVEHMLGRALITQTWKLILATFPWNSDERLWLPRAPLSSVGSITYVDTNGDSTTWGSSKYTVHTPSGPAAGPGWIEPVYGEPWPTAREQDDAVTVTFTAGYGASGSSVPSPILQAMKLLVGHWYTHREVVVTGTITAEVPHAVNTLLAPYALDRWDW